MNNELMEEDKIFYQSFLDAFGEDVQYTLAFEEMGELAQALSKYLRKRNSCTEEEKQKLIDNIIEEIADVKLQLDEVTFILDAWDKVKKVRDFKVQRSKERVKTHNLHLQIEDKKDNK